VCVFFGRSSFLVLFGSLLALRVRSDSRNVSVSDENHLNHLQPVFLASDSKSKRSIVSMYTCDTAGGYFALILIASLLPFFWFIYQLIF
jgi:hypothetical protein